MMMDMQANEVDLEDGELSDSGGEEVYVPLQRPASSNVEKVSSSSPLATCHQIQKALVEDEDVETNTDTSSGESGSSDSCIQKLRSDNQVNQNQRKRLKKRVRRTVMVRVTPTDSEEAQPNRARFKKYNIWTATLQEDALTENMRGCDVTRERSGEDRNVENYDFSLRYRLNGENSLKRRLSNSTDEESPPVNKRGRTACNDVIDECSQRISAKSRLSHRSHGRRSQRGSSSTSGSSDYSCKARHILDLDDTTGRKPLDIAREMASKLQEDKNELLVRVVEVLGIDLPLEIYKETQRIEADGGMLIKTGKRRRTPGGVFLFLLKHHDSLTTEQEKSIFSIDRQNANKTRKEMESMMRNRKVEELKKRLCEQGNELPALNTRKDHFLLGSDLGAESEQVGANLSNPPPSPAGQDHYSSPEYKSHAINHVATETPSTSTSTAAVGSRKLSASDLVSYHDDFLDVTCAEMDLF